MTGWIYKQRVIKSKKFCHIETLREYKELLPPSLLAEMENLTKLLAECLYLCSIGEHPAYHRYEMANEIFSPMKHLYGAGWVRFGTVDGCIHYEGNRTTLTQEYLFLREFAESNNLTLQMEPQ